MNYRIYFTAKTGDNNILESEISGGVTVDVSYDGWPKFTAEAILEIEKTLANLLYENYGDKVKSLIINNIVPLSN